MIGYTRFCLLLTLTVSIVLCSGAAFAAPLAHQTEDGSAPVVFMTTDISPSGLMAVYEALKWTPSGKVAIKLSTGEPPASNYLRPELIRDLVRHVNGTIVECNTAYNGSRAETAMHRQVAKDHGFTDMAEVDIMDEEGSIELPVVGGKNIKGNLVGSHFKNYSSFLILSHFKGHAMAGFGGAIKNVSIGISSRTGKCRIHSGGRSDTSPWGWDQDPFTETMAEACKSVSDAAFQIIGHTEMVPRPHKPGYFLGIYRSVMGSGRVRIVTDLEEKRLAIRRIHEHYHDTADDYEVPDTKLEKVVNVFSLEISEITGKIKGYTNPDKPEAKSVIKDW